MAVILQEKLEQLQREPQMQFLKDLSQQGKVFLVGGAIRDWMLSRETKDFDFLVTNLKPEQVDSILQQFGKNKAVESRSFGVFKFQPHGSRALYDIALPRKDRWTGLGYKDIAPQFGVPLEEDLSRRDFTMNAMALGLDGKLIDPFSGQRDLEKKIIRAVGEAKKRFEEDPSRILRGVRFACELGFEIEEETFTAMQELGQEIIAKTEKGQSRVSEEIIAYEFLKGFSASPKKMIELLGRAGILSIILPEVSNLKGITQPEQFHSEGDVLVHTVLALEKLEELGVLLNQRKVETPVPLDASNIHTKLGVLFHDIGKPATFKSAIETGDRIRFTGHDIEGAKMVSRIFKRLKLAVFPQNHPLHVDEDKLTFLVKHHMICVSGDIDNMRLSTLERYFFNHDGRGGGLLALSWADISATVPKEGQPDFSLFKKLLQKLSQVSETIFNQQKDRALPHLLSGQEIMKALNLPASKKIGEIKQELRELQLEGKIKTKEEALEYLIKKKK